MERAVRPCETRGLELDLWLINELRPCERASRARAKMSCVYMHQGVVSI